MYILNSGECLALITAIVSIGLAIDSIEYLFNAGHLEKEGIYSEYIFQVSNKNGANKIDRFIRHYLSKSVAFTSLIVLRLLLIVIVNFPLTNRFHFYGFMLLFIIEILSKYRCQFGRDGSDQMDTIIIAGLTVSYLLKNESLEIMGIAFIAFQSILSYFTSGFSKLFAPVWTSGNAIIAILNANSYGSKKAAAAILRIPHGEKIICMMVIILECLIPVSLFLPLKISIYFFSFGLIFHLSNAVVMGLNKFFWSWMATYPAIFFCHQILFS